MSKHWTNRINFCWRRNHTCDTVSAADCGLLRFSHPCNVRFTNFFIFSEIHCSKQEKCYLYPLCNDLNRKWFKKMKFHLWENSSTTRHVWILSRKNFINRITLDYNHFPELKWTSQSKNLTLPTTFWNYKSRSQIFDFAYAFWSKPI